MAGSGRRRGARVVVCDVGDLERAGAAEIDLLARLRLEAGRLGVVLVLANPNAELRELLAFCGLDAVLSAVEPRREAEQREQPLGVEEEADPGDPAA